MMQIASGQHAGLNWWVQRDDAGMFATAQGHVDGRYLYEFVDMPSASPADVKRWVDEIVAKRQAAYAKRRVPA